MTQQDFYNLEYESYFGFDFGISNPSAMVEVKFDGDRTFYVHELLYKPSSLMGMPIYKYIQDNVGRCSDDGLIVADSAKMKMVQDLMNGGLYAVPAIKGSGSVDAGISQVQAFNIVYTDTSHNLSDEYVTYSYVVDRYGLTTDQVIRKEDHLLDAMRYIISYLVLFLDIRL